ncbi:MAG: hypothetical protein JWP57_1552 [Spirosoma sp.]|nr:hypothetical protein [Spirosoma sp.]
MHTSAILTTTTFSPQTETVLPDRPDTRANRPISQRLQSIDVIRGVALLGILMMNIPGFALPDGLERQQTLAHPGDANYTTAYWVDVLFAGKMRALFSMLFGAGVILFTNRKQASDGFGIADFYYRRMLWLVVFGVVDAFFLLWKGDILYWYGLCGLLLFPLRNVPARQLALGALVCFSFLALKAHWRFLENKHLHEAYTHAIALEKQHVKLNDTQEASRNAWLGLLKKREPDPKQEAAEIKTMQSDYRTIWLFLLPKIVEIQSTFFYATFWDALGMMLLGMALLKWGVFSGQFRRRTYLMMVLLGYGIGIPLGMYAEQSTLEAFGNYGHYLDTHTVGINRLSYDLRRVLMALGHIGLIMLVFRSGLVPWLMQTLSAVGQMAFTNYVMHTLICTFIFFGYGLGYYGTWQYYQLFYIVVGIWLTQLIISPLWLRYFRFGPLEWGWRSLMYWKRQSMVRS